MNSQRVRHFAQRNKLTFCVWTFALSAEALAFSNLAFHLPTIFVIVANLLLVIVALPIIYALWKQMHRT